MLGVERSLAGRLILDVILVNVFRYRDRQLDDMADISKEKLIGRLPLTEVTVKPHKIK